MRVLYFVGASYCGPCNAMRRGAVEPLMAEFPGRVVAMDARIWNADLERIESRGKIARVPLVVVEDDGREVHRSVGMKGGDELRALLEGGS